MLPSLIGIIASSGGAVAGDYESIATVTVGSGGASPITFSSIPSTYTHLQIRAILRNGNNGASGTFGLNTTFNGDTGFNYSASHVLFGNGSSAGAGAGSTSTTSGSIVNYPGSAETANAFGVMVADILDYSNTSKYKTVRSLGGYDGNGSGIVTLRSFAWMSTSAITSISFATSDASNIAQYSSFALYGIKG